MLQVNVLPPQTPLIIYLFHFLVDYAEITFMVTSAPIPHMSSK